MWWWYGNDNLNYPISNRRKWRPYTKGPHNAKMARKRHAKNKVARQTRKMQRKKK